MKETEHKHRLSAVLPVITLPELLPILCLQSMRYQSHQSKEWACQKEGASLEHL